MRIAFGNWRVDTTDADLILFASKTLYEVNLSACHFECHCG